MDFDVFAKEVHENAVAHGWWGSDRGTLEAVALINSEWSEALEEYRDGHKMLWYSAKSKKPEGIAVELMDGVIRILDFLKHHEVTIVSDMVRERINVDFRDIGNRPLPELVSLLAYHTTQAVRKEWIEDIADEFLTALEMACAWVKANGYGYEPLLREKHNYNKTREYRHGWKKC